MPFFKLLSGQTAKNIGFAFLEDESTAYVPFSSSDGLFSPRDLSTGSIYTSLNTMALHTIQGSSGDVVTPNQSPELQMPYPTAYLC